MKNAPNVLPYTVLPVNEIESSFTTDNGITYSVEFIDYSFMFPPKEGLGKMFTFNFTPTNTDTNAKLKSDLRVKATILSVLHQFFKENNTALVTVCDSSDKRELYRHRLFGKWFTELKTVRIEKYDCTTKLEDITIYNSLLIHSKHPNKKKAIEFYFAINNNEFMPI